jgi:hypothetical protein
MNPTKPDRAPLRRTGLFFGLEHRAPDPEHHELSASNAR